MPNERFEVSRTIPAAAADTFRILADPASHEVRPREDDSVKHTSDL